ncbi:MAG: hypothetical protein ACREFX_02425 [Opitutaceae bacterium]
MHSGTIAVDLDDTLNNFSEVLRETPFVRAPGHRLSEELFHEYLRRLRSESVDYGELLSTDYGYFRSEIVLQCFALAQPRADGVDFMQWLRREGWRIVICTRRDLRRSHDVTRKWLASHAIPFDHLFMAANKIALCALWGIRHLVDDDPFNIAHGDRYGVRVYYPAAAGRAPIAPGATAFGSFAEIKPWIRKSR